MATWIVCLLKSLPSPSEGGQGILYPMRYVHHPAASPKTVRIFRVGSWGSPRQWGAPVPPLHSRPAGYPPRFIRATLGMRHAGYVLSSIPASAAHGPLHTRTLIPGHVGRERLLHNRYITWLTSIRGEGIIVCRNWFRCLTMWVWAPLAREPWVSIHDVQTKGSRYAKAYL